jgi:hypothetical protein
MRKGGAAATIVLLDACRLNAPPFGSAATRALPGGAARGLRVTAAALPAEDAAAPGGSSSGTVVAWACGDGQVAFDGDGNRSAHAQRNGLFTKHLLKHMTAGNTLDALLSRVREGVAEESLRRQLAVRERADARRPAAAGAQRLQALRRRRLRRREGRR